MERDGSNGLKVLFVTTEYAPFSKVGGLGDVAASLPKALRQAGVDVSVVTPAWRGVLDKVAASGFKTTELPERVVAAYAWHPHVAGVIRTFVEGVPVYFLDGEDYAGEMYPWHLDSRTASPFAVFCMQALELQHAIRWTPDIYHCHEWTGAFLPCALSWHRHYRGTRGAQKTVMTLHNMAHQGILDPQPFIEESGLDSWKFTPDTMEFYGKLNLLKGAIIATDALTTVSPTYAAEIQTYESTRELSAVLYKMRHKLSGIINGIDTDYWNPQKDPLIHGKFSAKSLQGKVRVRQELLRRANYSPQTKEPLVVCVSRLVEQKGFGIILPAIDTLARMGAKFLFLGSGHEWIEQGLTVASERYPETFHFFKGYDEPLAHLLYAGGDIFLMPSEFEPCGLSQMIAMRYGTIPLVREVGGLKDTVRDVDCPGGGNGFTFQTFDTEGLLWAMRRALSRYADSKAWAELCSVAMRTDFSWSLSAQRYKDLYRQLLPTE